MGLRVHTPLDQPVPTVSTADDPMSIGMAPYTNGAVNVQAYGAVGDGITDDTVAIQAALTAAKATGSASRSILLPPGTYRISKTIVLRSWETIYGEQARINWVGEGFCIQMAGSYNRVRGLLINVTDEATASDPDSIHGGYYGGIVVGACAATGSQTAVGNLIECCNIRGGPNVYSNPNSVGIFLHGHRADSRDFCAVYFNTISGNVIRQFYRGTLHRYEANANFYRDNLLWLYYKYGIDINTSSQNIVSGGFFHQAPGRSREDLTYAVHIGGDPTETAPGARNPIYNQLFYGAEPGKYSSVLYNDGCGTVAILNNNTPYGIEGAGVLAFGAMRSGYVTVGRTVRIEGRGGYSPLNVAARDVEPNSPLVDDVYLDNGVNTGSGQPGWRRWTGSAWVDIGAQNVFGVEGKTAGTITLWHGANGNSPGHIKIHSPNGTPYYLFVENDGTLKTQPAPPGEDNTAIDFNAEQ